MLCIAAIVAVHYTHINTCCIAAIVAVHYTHSYTCYALLLLLLYTYSVSYSLLKGLGNILWENTKANVLIEDQLWPPLDVVTVDQVRELH